MWRYSFAFSFAGDQRMCSCACGYANGYVNRMLQHVRHKFCWKAVVVRATNRPFAVTFQLAPIKLSLNRPHSLYSSFFGHFTTWRPRSRPKSGCDKLNPSAHSVEALITSGPNKLRGLSTLWSTQMANFPLQLSLWKQRDGQWRKQSSHRRRNFSALFALHSECQKSTAGT